MTAEKPDTVQDTASEVLAGKGKSTEETESLCYMDSSNKTKIILETHLAKLEAATDAKTNKEKIEEMIDVGFCKACNKTKKNLLLKKYSCKH